MNLTVSDGRKKYTINGDENRSFYVNLTDTEIIVRAKKAAQYIDSLSVDENMDEIDIAEFVNEEARKQVDYVFGDGVARVVFGNISPLAVVDRKTGKNFFEDFMEAIMPEIEREQKAFMKSIEDSEKRIQKYTQKYKKH